jgi:hypothetical protein
MPVALVPLRRLLAVAVLVLATLLLAPLASEAAPPGYFDWRFYSDSNSPSSVTVSVRGSSGASYSVAVPRYPASRTIVPRRNQTFVVTMPFYVPQYNGAGQQVACWRLVKWQYSYIPGSTIQGTGTRTPNLPANSTTYQASFLLDYSPTPVPCGSA